MKKQISFLLILLPIAVSAYNAKIKGIYYNFSGSYATVTYLSNNTNENENAYTGDVVIPPSVVYNGSTYTVNSIGTYAFLNCSSLTSVTIPESVKTIGTNAFSYCKSLTTITMPSNSVTTIRTTAFSYSGLTSITIPSSVTSMSNDIFLGCSELSSIVVETGNTKYDSRDNCNSIIETASNELIAGCKNTVIPNSVKTIGSRAFSECSGLTSIAIPNSVVSIEDHAFIGCDDLLSITIPNSVTSIGQGAFLSCDNLTSVTIPNSLTTISYDTFNGCSSLTSITIPNSVTSIGTQAFSGCISLSNITIPEGVKSIGQSAFSNCRSLTTITIPNSVNYIGLYAFISCYDLNSVIIGNGVETIGESAFNDCSSLKSVKVDIAEPIDIDARVFPSRAYATLYVPNGSKTAYQKADNWKDFKYIIDVKCATPTISFTNGKLKFDCETEGVTFVPTISFTDEDLYQGNEIDYGTTFRISVYAKKDGYENSDVVTKDFDLAMYLGDANHDGKVSIADAVAIVDIILNSPTPEPEIKYYYSVGAEEVTSANYTTVNNAQYKTSLAEIPETLDMSSVSNAKAYILLPKECVPIVRSTTGVVGTTSVSVGNEHTVYTTTSAINGSECTCTVYK